MLKHMYKIMSKNTRQILTWIHCSHFNDSQYNTTVVLTNEFQGKKRFKNLNPDIKIDSIENCVQNTDFILSIGGDVMGIGFMVFVVSCSLFLAKY